MAAFDGPNGELELRPQRKFADLCLGALVGADHAEMVAGFPSGRLFLESIEQAIAVALVNGHAVRHRSAQISRGGLGAARSRRIKELVHAKVLKPTDCAISSRLESSSNSSFCADVSQVNGRDPASICSAPKA